MSATNLSEHQRVFVSWSGDHSKNVAESLKDFLVQVIHPVDVFFSGHIEAGDRWLVRLSHELETTDFGLLVLTRDNLRSDWILFEAGALSKHVATSRVIPLLIDVDPSELPSPLAAFQATSFHEAGIRAIVDSINQQSKTPRSSRDLNRSWEVFWPHLESVVQREFQRIPRQQADWEIGIAEIRQMLRTISRQVEEATMPKPEGFPKQLVEEVLAEYPDFRDRIQRQEPFRDALRAWMADNNARTLNRLVLTAYIMNQKCAEDEYMASQD